MAQTLVFSYSILVDIPPFVAGDKIYTYWDDTTGFVVKADSTSPVLAGNIAASFNNGLYETVETTWFSVENEYYNGKLIGSGTDVGPSVNAIGVRSNVVAHSGTYSGKFTALSNSGPIITFQNAVFEVGKNYRISCYVYGDVGTPYTFSAAGTLKLTPTQSKRLTANNFVTKTVAECAGSWQYLSVDVNCLSVGTSRTYVGLIVTGGTPNGGVGFIYVDDFIVNELGGFTSSLTTITSGPDLGKLAVGRVTRWMPENCLPFKLPTDTGQQLTKSIISKYSFCDSVDEVSFYVWSNNPPFPYGNFQITKDSPSCVYIPPCDIYFEGEPILINPTNPYTLDGTIIVLAVSSKSIVRYNLFAGTDFSTDGDFSSYTNIDGTFTGLKSGIYTIRARDVNNCIATTEVNLTPLTINDPTPTPDDAAYVVKYRVDYPDIFNGVTARVDIQERGFIGTFTEANVGTSPFVRSLPSISVNNKFECIRPTYAIIKLLSEKDLQFIGLFSQDDRKYRVKYYKPVGTLLWSGFVTPSIMQQPYTENPPYYTEIKVTDNLPELSNLDFLDSSGNKLVGQKTFIQIVSLILQKLTLSIDIRVACNIKEQTSEDTQPFDDNKVELSAFYENDGTPWNCERVLKFILQAFMAKIVQENGVWNIVRVEEQTASYNYRQYTSLGVYSSSGTYDPIIEIQSPSVRLGAVFSKADAQLEIVPAYGKITLRKLLNKVENLVLNGSFDIDQFVNGKINGWIVNKLGGPVSYTVSKIINRNTSRPKDIVEGSYALTLSNIIGSSYVRIDAFPIRLIFGDNDSATLSFNYRSNMTSLDRTDNYPVWVRLSWFIKTGTNYYTEKLGWDSEASTFYHSNDIYISSFNSNQSFEVTFDFASVIAATASDLKLGFFVYGANNVHYSAGDVTSVPAVNFPVGKRIVGLQSGQYFWYTLEAGTDATSLPDIGRPSDYAASTNEVVWKLDKITTGSCVDIKEFYIDEVFLDFNPNKEKAPSFQTITADINPNFKENFDLPIEGGDSPSDIIHSAQYIFNNYFRNTIGEPTRNWTRDAVLGEFASIQQIAMRILVNQYKYPTFKVSGSFIGFDELNFLTTFKHTEPQPGYSLVNPEFTGSLTGWTNSSGVAWTYSSNKATVTLTVLDGSANLKQTTPIEFIAGQRIRIEFGIQRSSSSGSRNDWLEVVFLNDSGDIVQNSVLVAMSSDGTWSKSLRLSIAQNCSNIGFRIRNMTSGSCTYEMDYFRLSGVEIVRFFTTNAMEINGQENDYNAELMQLVPVVINADPDIDDSGEGNTDSEGGGGGGSGGGSGSSFSGDFNNDFGSSFDTTSN